MLGTLIAFISALVFLNSWYEVPNASGIDVMAYASYFLLISLLFLVIALAAICLAWEPIWQTQEKKIACAQELFSQDRWLLVQIGVLFAFCLFSLSFSLTGSSIDHTKHLALITGWILFFGVSFDVLRAYLRRLFNYTRYSFIIERLTKALRRAIRNDEESKAMEWIGVTIDSVLKAMQNGKISHVSKSFTSMHQLIETYVKELSRLASLAPPQPESVAPSFSDKVNFLCIYVCDRLEWLYENAIRLHAHPVAEEVISELGKLAIFFSRHSTRVANIPLSYITKCAMYAKNEDALVRASLILSQMCKEIVLLSKEKNESFRELFLTTLLSMEALVKTLYKQNKDINPVLLMQPFAEVGQFLGNEALKDIHDRQEILQEIRRILAQFQSLAHIVQNLEEVTGISEDSSSTYRQDMPYMPQG